jgi:hypothetical protein
VKPGKVDAQAGPPHRGADVEDLELALAGAGALGIALLNGVFTRLTLNRIVVCVVVGLALAYP